MLVRAWAALAALGFAASGAAAASVSERVEIAAAPDKVWAAIGDYCGIASWHPAVAKCEMAETDGKRVRTLTTGDGGKIVEPLESWDDAAMSYSYRIESSPLPVENYVSVIRVSGSGDVATVEWSSTFDPKGVSEADAVNVITGIYRIGFEGLQKKF